MLLLRTRAGVWRAAVCWLALAAAPAVAADPSPRPVLPVAYTPRTPAGMSAQLALIRDTNTRVYIVNGTDPFGWAGLARLAERFRAGGYPYTTYGQFYETAAFEQEIRTLYVKAPQTRFVLIGFSAGAITVRSAANRLVRDGIPVAMLGYIGGDFLTDTDYTTPAGVGRVVNVRGDGYLLTGRNLFINGAELTGAVNARLPESHFGLPSRPETYALLYAGLRGVSAGGP